MHLSNQVELVSITFIGIPLEAAMHFRPYQSNVNGETLNQLETITNGGLNVGTEVFSGIAGRIISPASQAKGTIDIPYGWKEKRYSIMMIFDVTTSFGVNREIITGYTGWAGISNQESLDPQMPIYINSHTVATRRPVEVNGVERNIFSSGGSMQVLSPVSVSNYNESSHEADVLLRPADIFTHQQLSEINLLNSGDTDLRSEMGKGYTPSRKINTIGSRYLSNVCRGYKSSVLNNSESQDEPGFIAGAASSSPTIMETSIHSSVLFSRLKDRTALGETGMVTVAELDAVWPGIMHDQQRKTVIHLSPDIPADMSGVVSHWGANNVETGIAYTLCQSVPAIMAELLFVTFDFRLTNRHSLDGSVSAVIQGYNFAVDIIDEPQRLQNMKMVLESDITSQIISRGVSDFDISMRCNIVGSNEVTVAVNGGQPIPFSAPAYCDSAYSPVITDSKLSLDTLTGDMSQMLSAVFGGTEPFHEEDPQVIPLY